VVVVVVGGGDVDVDGDAVTWQGVAVVHMVVHGVLVVKWQRGNVFLGVGLVVMEFVVAVVDRDDGGGWW
jgi:hypothetical protein